MINQYISKKCFLSKQKPGFEIVFETPVFLLLPLLSWDLASELLKLGKNLRHFFLLSRQYGSGKDTQGCPWTTHLLGRF